MHRIAACAIGLGLFCLPATAADLRLEFINNAGATVTTITAQAKDEFGANRDSIALLADGALEAGDSHFASLVPAEGSANCLYSLTFVFAGGETKERPDVDLCVTTGVIIE